MSDGVEPRQRHGNFSVAADAGNRAAALVGFYFSFRVDQVAKLGDAAKLFAFKDTAWRGIFWVSLPPGILFVIGSFMVAESPRWLLRRGKKDAAYAALLRSRTTEQADLELKEMQKSAPAEKSKVQKVKTNESLLRRKYVIPFVLACIILACNQPPASIRSSRTTPTSFCRAACPTAPRIWDTSLFTIVNFARDLRRRRACRPQGTQVSLGVGTAGIIVSTDLHRHFPQDREPARGCQERSPVDGHCRSEADAGLQRRLWLET